MWQAPISIPLIISLSWDVKVSHILRLWIQIAHILSYKVLDACIEGYFIPRVVEQLLRGRITLYIKILCNLHQINK